MFSIRHALAGAIALVLAACANPAGAPGPTPVPTPAAMAEEKPALIEFYADW
ncbi:MAG: hypothetical protein KA750_05300 [Thermoflexales bacterium]|jgi:hypothetical protein|nr:hypothetical protein [Thermoflexales bacterium]MBP8241875.1 hypothetical protein [Thermoflexales bacterium]